MDSYDKVDPEKIIEKLKYLIRLLKVEKRQKESSNEKNVPNSP